MPDEDLSREDKFLLAMYDQLWNNINRHVLVVWQPVAALGATLGLLSLVGNEVFGLDWATSLIVVVATWLIAHTIDASTWFDRNHTMIASIEKRFLDETTASSIHPVVGQKRTNKKPIAHFIIQAALGYAVISMILAHHFLVRVAPTLCWGSKVEGPKWIPYATALICLGVLVLMKRAATK